VRGLLGGDVLTLGLLADCQLQHCGLADAELLGEEGWASCKASTERARRIPDFLVSRKAPVSTDPTWIAGLPLASNDLDEVWGEGPEIRGTAEAVMMVLGGRTTVLDELTGASVAQLRARLAARRRP
jgi:hypothetical protein